MHAWVDLREIFHPEPFEESLLSLTHLSFRATKFKFLVFGFLARPASLHLSDGDLGNHPCGEDANRSGKKNVPGATSGSLDSGSPRFLALRMKMVSNGREVETEDRPLASAMETDAPLHSNTKSFPNPRKRMNGKVLATLPAVSLKEKMWRYLVRFLCTSDYYLLMNPKNKVLLS